MFINTDKGRESIEVKHSKRRERNRVALSLLLLEKKSEMVK